LKQDVSSKIRYIDKDGILSKTLFAEHFSSSKVMLKKGQNNMNLNEQDIFNVTTAGIF